MHSHPDRSECYYVSRIRQENRLGQCLGDDCLPNAFFARVTHDALSWSDFSKSERHETQKRVSGRCINLLNEIASSHRSQTPMVPNSSRFKAASTSGISIVVLWVRSCSSMLVSLKETQTAISLSLRRFLSFWSSTSVMMCVDKIHLFRVKEQVKTTKEYIIK